jgi:SAM-dependent methyltransferase
MAVFSEYAEYYNLLYRDKNYKKEVDYIQTLWRKYAPKHPKSLLDIGCGTGRHDAEFSKLGCELCGVDPSPEMLKQAKKNVPEASFIEGTAAEFNLDKTFDTVVSLFHVMSYQCSNTDLYNSFKNAFKHLNRNGLFIFDFWYGPAVLRDLPQLRTKHLENELIEAVRHTSPKMMYNENVVEVNFDLHIKNKLDNSEKNIKECHLMRYLFMPELTFMLEQVGFKILHSGKWMSPEPLSETSWYGIVVAQK